MKLDSLAAEVGFDVNMDTILARVEQLVKLEGDAVIENKTMAYSLKRKVSKKGMLLLFDSKISIVMVIFLWWLARGSSLELHVCTRNFKDVHYIKKKTKHLQTV